MGSFWSGIKAGMDTVWIQLQALADALEPKPNAPPHVELPQDNRPHHLVGNPYANQANMVVPDAICEQRQMYMLDGRHIPELDQVNMQVAGPGDYLAELHIQGHVLNGNGQVVGNLAGHAVCKDCLSELQICLQSQTLSDTQIRMRHCKCHYPVSKMHRHGNDLLCTEHAQRRGLHAPIVVTQLQTVQVRRRVTNLTNSAQGQ